MSGDAVTAEQIGGLTLYQREGLQKLTVDSLLLAEFATLRPGSRVCDLGCGIGTLPVLLAAREPRLSFTGVELEDACRETAEQNFVENQLNARYLAGDLREVRTLLPAGQFDLVISNPPYYQAGRGKSALGSRGTARHSDCTEEELCRAAGWLLHPGGRFAVVYPPERLDALLGAMTASGIAPKRLRLCQHNAEKPPFALLCEGVRQGRPGLSVLPVRLWEETPRPL